MEAAVAVIVLTKDQVAAVVAGYLAGLGEDDTLALFTAAMKSNLHTVDHISVARRYALAVEKQCLLPPGTVLGGKRRPARPF
jgi:ADP-ribosylglycohydrolase